MDQLEILERLQKILEEYEKSFEKHYARMQNKLIDSLQEAYEKYGNNLSEYRKYNRLQVLIKQIDSISSTEYKKLLEEAIAMQEETFNMTYLLYTYLVYMYLSGEEGKLLNITSATAGTSAAVAIIFWLLKNRKRLLTEFLKEESYEISLRFNKHKDDYVYTVLWICRTI